MQSSIDLLDANMWVALAAQAHTHHRRASQYWESEAAPSVAFCRVTQLAFLRHLTNKIIMGDDVLSPGAAWKKCGEFLALPEVQFLQEPAGLDDHLANFCAQGRTSQNLWTDAYLAAFARTAGVRLVTFDVGFGKFAQLDTLVLQIEK